MQCRTIIAEPAIAGFGTRTVEVKVTGRLGVRELQQKLRKGIFAPSVFHVPSSVMWAYANPLTDEVPDEVRYSHWHAAYKWLAAVGCAYLIGLKFYDYMCKRHEVERKRQEVEEPHVVGAIAVEATKKDFAKLREEVFMPSVNVMASRAASFSVSEDGETYWGRRTSCCNVLARLLAPKTARLALKMSGSLFDFGSFTATPLVSWAAPIAINGDSKGAHVAVRSQ